MLESTLRLLPMFCVDLVSSRRWGRGWGSAVKTCPASPPAADLSAPLVQHLNCRGLARSRACESCHLCYGCSVGEIFPRKGTAVSPPSPFETEERTLFLPPVHHRRNLSLEHLSSMLRPKREMWVAEKRAERSDWFFSEALLNERSLMENSGN